MDPHLTHNREAWTNRARRGAPHTQRADETLLANPLQALDPEGWLGPSIAGRRVLCFGSGGGLQSVLCAKAGAEVTVLDLSPGMLELDALEARRLQLRITTIESSFDRPTGLPESGFDVILQPVSTCYVPDVLPVYREAYRVLKSDGLYISQHKQPVSLQSDTVPTAGGYRVTEPYRRAGPLPPALDGQHHREADTLEYLHTWEQLVGGLCKSGFQVEGLVEPGPSQRAAEPGSFAHRSSFIPPYVKVLARRPLRSILDSPEPVLWVP